MRRAGPGLLLLTLLLPACRYAEESRGDVGFVERAEGARLEPGKSTALDVARVIGPPGLVWARDEELWFLYRSEEVRDRSLVLRYFGGHWVQGNMGSRRDRTLVIVFGERDQLLLRAFTQQTE